MSRALAADRVGFDCELSAAKEVFEVSCTARQASHILGNHAFGWSYFAQVQLRYSICAQVCDQYYFAVATEHIFAGKRITKSTRLFRGQTPMTHSAPPHRNATVNLAINWLHLAALDTSM